MTIENRKQAGEMRRYLLGELPEAEQVALEARFFADPELLERFRETEHELVDGYVRERLPRAEREQFERSYLTMPGHQESVAFARELLRAADARPAAQPAGSLWERLAAALRAPQFALGAAAALILALLAGGAWVARERVRWEQQLAQSRAAGAAEQQRARDLEEQIARQRAQNEQLKNEEAGRIRETPRPVAEPPASQSILSFILLSPIRASGEQQTLKLPPGATQVQLQMRLERDEYRRYLVRLRPVDSSPAGGADWQSGAVKASRRANGTTLSVNVPAGRLRPADYILTLSGADGATEEIDRYFFRVRR